MIKVPIHIAEYDYPLPENRIAKYPLPLRDQSKLLIFKGNQISENIFNRISEQLPEHSLLIFNNTRVIRARLIFKKESGTRIEIFCLQPEGGYGQTGGASTWKCLIGNAKRWKSGSIQLRVGDESSPVILSAIKGERTGDAYLVHFNWEPQELAFEQVLEISGKTPLPPYLNRDPEASDQERYQTIYAQFNGSVAAPTAGLHFTPYVLQSIENKHIKLDYLTLHVGAGTFKPVMVADAREHEMHKEELIVERGFLLRLIQSLQHPVIPVGTTSMRSLESLYWLGIQILNGKEPDKNFIISQWEPYQQEIKTPAVEALQAIVDFMGRRNMIRISGYTGIMIAPGYTFRICSAIITNFHQPKSTLLLLVSAFIGKNWGKVYDYALEHDFRFLSYGDSCLFFPENTE
ncbi:MAG: S-adenosylmethionine:tRNA ribosyltransferase-isomerase [Lentimicrobium sp.]|jgi:S-adenosylmethionine:tRNA ribosyltransferase-isomerase|nr:S-adenosylmethionine:tRNA ribosyltransferase-isomerase [Lentimicrobium sp.]